MTKIASALMAAAKRLEKQFSNLTFGLPEAIVISLLGIAVAAIAAYANVHRPGS